MHHFVWKNATFLFLKYDTTAVGTKICHQYLMNIDFEPFVCLPRN